MRADQGRYRLPVERIRVVFCSWVRSHSGFAGFLTITSFLNLWVLFWEFFFFFGSLSPVSLFCRPQIVDGGDRQKKKKTKFIPKTHRVRMQVPADLALAAPTSPRKCRRLPDSDRDDKLG